MSDLDALIECFDAVSEGVPPYLRPRPTIALVLGGLSRSEQARTEGELWQNAESILGLLTAGSRDRGYEPCLHNELGTLISSEADVARGMQLSDISLCLDTGHYFAGGGDSLAALRAWGDRIYQVHVKDSHREPYLRVIADGRPVSSIWDEEVFCKLGDGEAEVRPFLEALVQSGYSGWLVVEQDILPQGAESYARAADDQVRNRTFLKQVGIEKSSPAQSGPLSSEEVAFDGVRGLFEGSVVGSHGLVAAALARQEIGPGRVVRLVAVER